MLVIIIPRDESIHISDQKTNSGTYWTVCGECFTKKDIINTIAADNTFPGICIDCKILSDMIYQMNLDDTPIEIRHDLFISFHKKNYLGPKAKFIKASNHVWNKLAKYKNLSNRKKEHE
jgi:hypothetical protein